MKQFLYDSFLIKCISWSSLQRYGMTIFFCLLLCSTWYTWWYRKAHALLLYHQTKVAPVPEQTTDLKYITYLSQRQHSDMMHIVHSYPVEVKECKQLLLKEYPWCRSYQVHLALSANFFTLWRALAVIHDAYDVALIKSSTVRLEGRAISYAGDIKLYTHWRVS